MDDAPSREWRELICKICLESGFAAAGFTVPAEPESFPAYQRWIDQGLHAEMNYLASQFHIESRKDIRSLFPECKSVLVLLLRYPDPKSLEEPLPGYGRIAAYARGQDYHELLPDKIAALMEVIQQKLGIAIEYRYFTDSGPILETDLAQRAGLGWVGKNSLLINRDLGSYFFVAEILMDLELEPDPPFSVDHCGSCTRCIDACPTGCIRPDRTIDAGRCISYLTIENKKVIPEELRPLVGDWLFGCDICQMVCPWNQRVAPFEVDSALQPDPDFTRPLHEFLNISKRDFNKVYQGSPISRPKQRGLARNAALVMGNRLELEGMHVLAQALREHEEPIVRGQAAWSLGRYGKDARKILEAALEKEVHEQVLGEINRVLEGLNQSSL